MKQILRNILLVSAAGVLVVGGAYATRGVWRPFMREMGQPDIPVATPYNPVPVSSTTSEQPIPVTTTTTTTEVIPIPAPPPVEIPSPRQRDPFVFEGTRPEEVNLAVPFISQAPKGNWDMPYQEACEEASLLMVDAFLRGQATDPSPDEADRLILDLVAYQTAAGDGPDITLQRVADIARDRYGFRPVIQTITTPEPIRNAIANGYPVILPASGKELRNPNFRNGGPVYHMLVAKGYVKNGGIITNDPGTRHGKNYVYDADTLFDAIHDLNGRDVTRGEKVVLVLVPQDELSLLVVGDVMLDRTVADRTRASGRPDYPLQKIPASWVAGFDLAVANLEGPVTPLRRPPVKSIDFQFDPSWLSVFKAHGWDVFSQANNHALDQGALGYADSVSRLREAGFISFGHQVDDGLIALATTTVKGQTIAFLGWNTTDNPLNRAQALEAITVAKQEADLLMAYVHWGNEYRARPDPESVKLAHWLIDQGVDLVIGGHPHWVQGFSTYKNRLIAWSLGNFIFDQDWSKETQQGLAIELRITPNEVRLLPVPLRIIRSQPEREVGEDLAKRLEALAAISDSDLQATVKAGKELVVARVQ